MYFRTACLLKLAFFKFAILLKKYNPFYERSFSFYLFHPVERLERLVIEILLRPRPRLRRRPQLYGIRGHTGEQETGEEEDQKDRGETQDQPGVGGAHVADSGERKWICNTGIVA